MEKLFCLLLFFLVACNLQKTKLDGAYELAVTKYEDSTLSGKNIPRYKTVQIFKNGYWITTSFTEQSFIKCSGGTYKLVNGNYIQRFNFNTADTSLIGKQCRYKFYSDGKYLIANFGDSGNNRNHNVKKDVYEKITASEPLKNAFLEGVWIMKAGQGGYNTNNDEVIRIFAYPFFTRTIYNSKEKMVVATYSGTYQFDGENLAETIKYTFSDIALGSRIEWNVKKLAKNEIQLFDIDSFYDEEIYDRPKNQ